MRSLIACVLALGAFLSFAGTATAAPQQIHKDTRFGFQVKGPKEWTPIPLKADEQWLLAKWLSDKTYFWTEPGGGWTYDHKPEAMVIGFVHKVTEKEDVEVETEEDEDGDEVIKIRFNNPYKNYEDYLDRTYTGGGFYISDRKEAKHKGLEVTKLEIKVEKLARSGPKRIITWVYHLEDADVAVQFEVLEDHYKKVRSLINSTLKSFKPIPREDVLPTHQDASDWITVSMMDKGSPADRRKTRMESVARTKDRILASLPEDWTHKKYGRVHVVSHVDDRYNKWIASQAEAILDYLDEEFHFIGPDEYVRDPIVRICKDDVEERSFASGRSAGGSGGYYSGNEIVTHKSDSGKLDWEIDYLNMRVADLWFRDRDRDLYWALPSWLETGLDGYIENLRVKGRGVEHRVDDWDRDELRNTVREGQATSPRDLIRMTDTDFRENATWNHVRESAALVEYLMHGPGSKDKRTKGLLQNFIRDLKAVVDEIEKEEEGTSTPSEAPKTEEEEEEMYKKRAERWKAKEKLIMERTMERTFGGWTDKDWDAFEKKYFDYIG